MKTYTDVVNDVQDILEKEGENEEALLAYCQENANAFPEELRIRLAPLLFEAELMRETKKLEGKNTVATLLLGLLEEQK